MTAVKTTFHFVRLKKSAYPDIPEVLKIEVLSPSRYIIKRVIDGTEEITDFDFSNLVDGGRVDRNYSDTVYSVEHNGNEFFVKMCSADTTATDALADEGGHVETFPEYLYLAEGETETPETPTVTPSWLPVAPTGAEVKAKNVADWKLRLKVVAKEKFEDFNFSQKWAHEQARSENVCLDLDIENPVHATEMRKADNTSIHWTKLIGLGDKVVKLYEDALGAIPFTFAKLPIFETNVVYKVDQVVVYEKDAYRCLQNYTATVDTPRTPGESGNSAYWRQISLPEWEIGSHTIGNYRLQDSKIYKCLQTHVSDTENPYTPGATGSETYWAEQFLNAIPTGYIAPPDGGTPKQIDLTTGEGIEELIAVVEADFDIPILTWHYAAGSNEATWTGYYDNRQVWSTNAVTALGQANIHTVTYNPEDPSSEHQADMALAQSWADWNQLYKTYYVEARDYVAPV